MLKGKQENKKRDKKKLTKETRQDSQTGHLCIFLQTLPTFLETNFSQRMPKRWATWAEKELTSQYYSVTEKLLIVKDLIMCKRDTNNKNISYQTSWMEILGDMPVSFKFLYFDF